LENQFDFIVVPLFRKGLSIKDVRSREEEGGLSSLDILRTKGEGVLQMRTSALFGAKNFGFRNLGYVSTGGGMVESVLDILRTKEEKGVNFSRFCADFFYGV